LAWKLNWAVCAGLRIAVQPGHIALIQIALARLVQFPVDPARFFRRQPQ
jgi:hypothetical protein